MLIIMRISASSVLKMRFLFSKCWVTNKYSNLGFNLGVPVYMSLYTALCIRIQSIHQAYCMSIMHLKVTV